jgi:hypothetical protein
MMARLKGLSVRIIFNLGLMIIWACGLLPIRPKSQNSNIRHDVSLSIRNFMLMLKKPMDPNLGPLCSMGSMAMIRPKSQNTSIPSEKMVLKHTYFTYESDTCFHHVFFQNLYETCPGESTVLVHI